MPDSPELTQGDVVEWLREAITEGAGILAEECIKEIEALRHDLERHIAIAADLATELDRLRRSPPAGTDAETLRSALFTAYQFLKPNPGAREGATLIGCTTVYGYMRREDAIEFIRQVLDKTSPSPLKAGEEGG